MKSTAISFTRNIPRFCFLYACFLVFGTFAEAQEAQFYRVGVLVVGGADISQIKGLRDGLKNYGYVQGKNLSLEVSAKETYDELRPLIKSYKEKNVNVLVTI